MDDEEDDEEELNAIEKHMSRTMNKKKLHKNTVRFEDELKKKSKDEDFEDKEADEKAVFDEEMEVYRSDEEYEQGKNKEVV